LCVFQPLRSCGRVIWKPRVAPERVRDLVRPVLATAQGLELCLSCGENCTSLQSLSNLFE
jgi:hypothetical protein